MNRWVVGDDTISKMVYIKMITQTVNIHTGVLDTQNCSYIHHACCDFLPMAW